MDNGIGDVPVNGSVTVSPVTNTTYTITAEGAGGTVASDITVYVRSVPEITFRKITISPDAIFVNESEYVVIKANIPYNPIKETPVATLRRVDADGNLIATEGGLTDDGNLDNGDEIAGDGLFTIRKMFSSSVEETIHLQILVSHDSGTKASDVFTLDVFTRMTDEEFEAILALQTNAVENYEALVGSVGEEEAINTVLSQIQSDPIVLQAGISGSGRGVWILYTYGILGAVNLNTRDESVEEYVVDSSSSQETVSSLSRRASRSGDEERIGNRKAIVLSPFNWDLQDNDFSHDIYKVIENSICPDFDVRFILDDGVTIEEIETLDNYGLIYIYTHGDTYYKGIYSLWMEKLGWEEESGQVTFYTSQKVTNINRKSYEGALYDGKLAITTLYVQGKLIGTYYSILPSFIHGNFPDSLVYLNACRSAYNDTMANAFLSQGAKTYLGNADYISQVFAGGIALRLFQKFYKKYRKISYHRGFNSSGSM